MDLSRSSRRNERVVTIVGGGASAHVLIPFLADAGYRVRLLTRRPRDWSEQVELQLRTVDQEILQTFTGRVADASDDPATLIPQSEIVVLCMPVHAYRTVLHEIAPHLPKDREVFVGTIYGQAGFHWMVDEIAMKFDLPNLVAFAAGLIPWICRVAEYGRTGITYGGKAFNIAAVSPRGRYSELEEFLHALCERPLGRGAFHQAESFLSLTLSVDNQIIHPTRCYGLAEASGGSWEHRDDVPYFYRDYDERSASLLRDLDADYSAVRRAIRRRYPEREFPYMLDYLSLERLTYATKNSDIRESFTTSKTLGAIGTPVRRRDDGAWELDTDHRFFTDDVAYGVCIAKWLAERLEIETPMMDEIIRWVQEIRGETYLRDDRLLVESESLSGPFRSGIPPVYGIETIDEAVDGGYETHRGSLPPNTAASETETSAWRTR